MKKIILAILILFSFTNITFAEGDEESSYVIVRVTEKVPWVSCPLQEDAWKERADWTIVPMIYECSVPRWVYWVTVMLWNIIKYATFITGLLWVMFLVYSWVMYSMWWANDGFKTAAKERIWKTVWWLILLLLSWYILQFVAPWVYK